MNGIRVSTLLTIAFVLLNVFAAMSQTLSVGMQAPPLKVGAWVKGGPVENFKPGQIYVVEFWGTWCKPCMTVIPMLTSYAEKYKGKVTVIGVSIYEENTANVAPFVKKMGEKMNYNVAIDQQKSATAKQGYMAKEWVSAANAGGLPLTFVVGKTGKIEYIGGADLRSVLPQIIEGTWTIITDEDWLQCPLASKRAKILELIKTPAGYNEALEELEEYAQMPGAGRDLYPKAWALAQKALVCRWMGKSEEFYRAATELYDYYKQVPATYLGWESFDRTGVLNNVIVWSIVNPEESPSAKISRTGKDYEFALTVAKHIVKFNPDDLNALDSQAWAYYHVGDYQKAKQIFERLREVLPNDQRMRASYELFKSKIK